jgi:hypothetical protein
VGGGRKTLLFLKKKKQKDFLQWPVGSRSQPDCGVGWAREQRQP